MCVTHDLIQMKHIRTTDDQLLFVWFSLFVFVHHIKLLVFLYTLCCVVIACVLHVVSVVVVLIGEKCNSLE